MKKILLTLTAVLALTLTGCNTGTPEAAPSPMPVPTVTVTAEPEPVPTVTVTAEPEPGVLDTGETSEIVFLMALRKTNPDLNDWTDEAIMDLAERTCVELDSGVDLQDFMVGTLQIKGKLYGDTGYGSPLGTVVAATVYTYCPEYSNDIQELTSP